MASRVAALLLRLGNGSEFRGLVPGLRTSWLTMDPRALFQDLRQPHHPALKRRRAIIGLSLVGIASMAATSLFQMGMARHLPDPPFDGFDSDKVNASATAYRFGVPDGPLALLNFALNLVLASWGPSDRVERQPWVPLLAAAKAGSDALIAGWYFSEMPRREKAWCGYCVCAALVSWLTFAVAAPEGRQALRAVRRGP